MRFLRALLVLIVLCGLFVFGGRLLYPLPDLSEREISLARPVNDQSRLGALSASLGAQNPGKTGVLALESGQDALISRLALAEAAETEINAQYYIWQDDTSGILLLEALRRAAERGVRVRLLLDDNGVPGMDGYLSALNALDKFDIRLFNPSTVRSPKIMGYAFDFMRMNRRMHNKSFTVDGVTAIIGGRNIGNDYFRVGENDYYVDLDVLATGEVVQDTVNVFDDYWNSASVFELETIIPEAADLSVFTNRAQEIRDAPEAQAFFTDIQSTAQAFIDTPATLEWTDVRLVADDPVKGLGIARPDQLTITRLTEMMGHVQDRLDLVSAYFIAGTEGTTFFGNLVAEGAEVNILTNALNTTDVLLVHSGYTKYRRALLDAGVRLFELKLRGGATSPSSSVQVKPFGLSGASLHAKTFAIDQRQIFIGSFNFDPRSAQLNTEMGYLIDSPDLARRLSRAFDDSVPEVSYQPRLSAEDRLVWIEADDAGDFDVYQQEPGATLLQQITLTLMGCLPIEWML
ncbi:phospholipase D family protein [Pseudooceanicola algae]|uniref:Phospholipase D n=1 Tax=Pseudooceanicola algae TaxID=1537215 RepID=A0A418SEI0_9RHOB|nr:phospholipase D family protein [Pseudooceanicola algae]QPM89717.1 Cardiolipin synthase C [Pseudooceanicola algae]